MEDFGSRLIDNILCP